MQGSQKVTKIITMALQVISCQTLEAGGYVPAKMLRVYRERQQPSKLASKVTKSLYLFNSLCCRRMKSTVKVKNATP
jgi:hypothetical protein